MPIRTGMPNTKADWKLWAAHQLQQGDGGELRERVLKKMTRFSKREKALVDQKVAEIKKRGIRLDKLSSDESTALWAPLLKARKERIRQYLTGAEHAEWEQIQKDWERRYREQEAHKTRSEKSPVPTGPRKQKRPKNPKHALTLLQMPRKPRKRVRSRGTTLPNQIDGPAASGPPPRIKTDSAQDSEALSLPEEAGRRTTATDRELRSKDRMAAAVSRLKRKRY